MGVLRFLVGLVAALGVHVVGTWLVPTLPRLFDPFLVLVVVNALGASGAGGLLGGATAGLVHDSLTGRLYGLHGFADTIVGYAVARAAQWLDLTGAGAVLVTTALATLLEETLLVLVALLFTEPEPPEPAWVLLQAALNGLAALALFVAAGRMRRVRDGARRRRSSKIRL